MKRVSVVSLLLLLTIALNAQEMVSTIPSNRNVIIEEYTGVYCQYCPEGHKIANEIVAAYPDNIFVINIHAGTYATTSYPNFTTEDGNVLFSGYPTGGFPSALVNRTTENRLSRSDWGPHASEQIKQIAECNVAGQVTIDKESRKATVTVEVYYTSNSVAETNYLNVVMLQNNMDAYQSGSENNSNQVVNGQYRHMHALRDAITPTWGDAISPTTAGTLITKTYTYDIPQNVGGVNGFDVKIEDIEFIAFVTEQYQGAVTSPVLNANRLQIAFVTSDDIHPEIISLGLSSGISCSNDKVINVAISNSGVKELTSLKFEVSIDNKDTVVKTWEGSMPSYKTSNVALELNVPEGTHDINVKIVEANGVKYENSKNLSINNEGWSVLETVNDEAELTIELMQDKYGSQITWELLASDYSVLASGGPYENLKGSSATELHNIKVKVPVDECVKFIIKDSKGNGICCQYGDGYYRILDEKGNVVVDGAGDFGAEASCLVSVTKAGDGLMSNDFEQTMNVYPNPVYDRLYIETESVVKEVSIHTLTGVMVGQQTTDNGQQTLSIDVTNLNSGVYFVKIVTDNGEVVKRFVKN